MMCLRRGARSMPARYSLLHFSPAPLGVCFGKAAIIRPRAPPRDDKLQSIECDTRHSAKFLGSDASGDGRCFAANRMKIGTTFIHTQAGFLTCACTKRAPSLAPPDEASTNTAEHAKTEKKLYFNAPNVDSFDIKTYETRTSETVPSWGSSLHAKWHPISQSRA